MQILQFDLRKEKTEYGFMPHLDVFLLDPCGDVARPMVIICPGGGYRFCSEREADRIALQYNAAGYHAAVVYYSVAPHKAPNPIYEVAESFRIARSHADEWKLNPDKIAVCGFSAGGHLAASISSMWNCPELFSEEEIESRLHRPDASILCYPVIAPWGHKGSFDNLVGEEEALREFYSVEKHVDEKTPPAFLFHTYEDKTVSVENSFTYASALRKYGVPFEFHVYPKGGHGLSLVSDEAIWSKNRFARDYGWMKLSIDFLNELFEM